MTKEYYHALATRLATSKAAFDVLATHDIHCGFMDGCCLAFAEAMRLILKEGEIYAVVTPDSVSGRNDHTIEHAVLRVLDPETDLPLYIDADGAQSHDELQIKMDELENRPLCVIQSLDEIAEDQGINTYEATWYQQSDLLKFEQLTDMVFGYWEIKMPEKLAEIGDRILRELNQQRELEETSRPNTIKSLKYGI